MSTLRLQLASDEGRVTFDALVHSMERALHMLRDVDRVLSAKTRTSVTWTVTDLMMNSPSPVAVLTGAPRAADTDERFIERVSAGFVTGLDVAERGDVLPQHFSDVGLGHLKALAAELGRDGPGRFAATYVEEELRAEISSASAENVARLSIPRSKAIGSVIGRLEVVSIHEGHRYSVYDDLTKRAVTVAFAPDELEKIKEALGRRVTVSGIIHRNAKGQPLRVEQPRLQLILTEDQLPTTEDLIGLDPDFTGDLTTDEYLDELRNA